MLDFEGDPSDALVAEGSASICGAWACFHTTMFSIDVEGVPFGLIPRTIGGPYAVLVAEQLLASGAKIILGLTSAGRVNPDLSIPGIVVATAAIRDEGTSYHYLPAGNLVSGEVRLANFLAEELRELALPVTTGTLWTTDAPYRETEEQLALHASNAVSAVEMQAASLFAFALARSAAVGIVAHVTNAVDHKGQPFDKGTDVASELILRAMCRAGRKYLASPNCSS